MNILVCFKAVEDIDKLTTEDWVLEGNKISLQYLPKVLNCFDESALELTLRIVNQASLNENNQEEVKISALTVGNSGCERFLRLMLALKFDKAVHVQTDEDIDFVPSLVAEQIAEFTQNYKQDFIITGSSAGLGDNGQTGLFLAEMLCVPCFTNIINMTYESNNQLRILRDVDDGIIEEIISAPAVLTIGNAQVSYLRVSTLKDKINAKNAKIESMPFIKSKRDIEEPKIQLLEVKSFKRNSHFIIEENIEEKALSLYTNFLKDLIKNVD